VWTAAGRAVCPVRIVYGDATELCFPMAHAWCISSTRLPAPVMQRLVERIEEDFRGRCRACWISSTFNPEAGELLEAPLRLRVIEDRGRVTMFSRRMHLWTLVASPEDLCSVYRWVGR